MSVLDYTGPVTQVTFQSVVNPDDKFAIRLHSNAEDIESIERIVARYAEDGYKPVSHLELYSIRGVIEDRKPREANGPAGFPSRSAFLRA